MILNKLVSCVWFLTWTLKFKVYYYDYARMCYSLWISHALCVVLYLFYVGVKNVLDLCYMYQFMHFANRTSFIFARTTCGVRTLNSKKTWVVRFNRCFGLALFLLKKHSIMRYDRGVIAWEGLRKFALESNFSRT